MLNDYLKKVKKVKEDSRLNELLEVYSIVMQSEIHGCVQAKKVVVYETLTEDEATKDYFKSSCRKQNFVGASLWTLLG